MKLIIYLLCGLAVGQLIFYVVSQNTERWQLIEEREAKIQVLSDAEESEWARKAEMRRIKFDRRGADLEERLRILDAKIEEIIRRREASHE